MKPSSCLLFLGCWLAGQGRPSAGQLNHKPYILVFPHPEVIQGENVRIFCGNAPRSHATFYLLKQKISGPVQVQQRSSFQSYSVEFPIPNVQPSDGGSYRCGYCIITEFQNQQCSSDSDPVSIVVTGHLIYKPSISVFPRPEVIQGENVRISCGNALYPHATFHLYKGFGSQPVKVQQPSNSQSYLVEFHIPNVQQSDGGSYRCVYCSIAESRNPQCSSVSDAVSIVVTAEVYPKPSISVSPGELLTRGENASIRCNSSLQANAEFILRQTAFSFSETYLTKKTESEEVVFPIGQAKSLHAGMYQCRYCLNSDSAFYKRCSNYSDKAYINITDSTLSRPSIRIRPKLQVSLGLNATIECQGPEYSSPLTFFLFKSGNLIASQKEDTMKNTTQFLLSSVRLEDAGSYSCRYQRINPFVQSEPSDAVELIVADNSSLVLWAGIGAGLLVSALVLVVLLLAFLWCNRRRRKGPAGSKQPEPVKNARSSTSLNLDMGEDPIICYAVLKHHSVKSEQEAGPVQDLDTCTYASVARENSL